MNTWRKSSQNTGNRFQLIAGICLLFSASTAYSATWGQCMRLYEKSSGVPGTPSCLIDTAGTSPVNLGDDDPYNGMNYYNCYSATAWLKDYCGGAPVPPQTDDSCPVADPVLPAKGIVTLSETDFSSGDASPLVFRRVYLSTPYDGQPSTMGPNWSNNWQRRIVFAGANASLPSITVYRGDAQPVVFGLSNGVWSVSGSPWLSLEKANDGHYYLKDEALGTTEAYSDTSGLFESETTRTGMYREVVYNGAKVVGISQWSVAHKEQPGYSMYLRLTYDSSGRVLSLVTPSGYPIQYAYDDKGNLSSFTEPDAYVRQYVYDDIRFPNALTGIKDEFGSRVATWTYDSKGRAISVTHPDTTRNVALSYQPGMTTLKDVAGSTSYSFDTLSTFRPRSISSPTGTVTRSWDSSDNLKQKVTKDGSTQYTWDNTNRPTKAIAVANGVKAVTTIEYSASTSLRPHLVSTPRKIRAFSYDSSGNVTGFAEQQTSDQTGEAGMSAAATGNQWSVGARYDEFDRMIGAIVMHNGVKTEDWSYSYDRSGNIDTARDAVTGWSMQTTSRDVANRARRITGNTGTASIAYDTRGRVSNFQYNEPANSINGGLSRVLSVDYKYGPDGKVSSRVGQVSKNGAWWQPISDAELGIWLTNWETGNDPVAPSAALTGITSDTDVFVPKLCVECYLVWKAQFAGKLFGDELSDEVAQWREATELKVTDQAKIPYSILIPDLTGSAKRSTLYSSLLSGTGNDGGMVNCASKPDEWRQADCHDKYEHAMQTCQNLAKIMGGVRGLALCQANAFQDYQECRGY